MKRHRILQDDRWDRYIIIGVVKSAIKQLEAGTSLRCSAVQLQ